MIDIQVRCTLGWTVKLRLIGMCQVNSRERLGWGRIRVARGATVNLTDRITHCQSAKHRQVTYNAVHHCFCLNLNRALAMAWCLMVLKGPWIRKWVTLTM